MSQIASALGSTARFSRNQTGSILQLNHIWPSFQGILLTAEGLAFFIVVMMLIPKIQAAWIAPAQMAVSPPAAPA